MHDDRDAGLASQYGQDIFKRSVLQLGRHAPTADLDRHAGSFDLAVRGRTHQPDLKKDAADASECEGTNLHDCARKRWAGHTSTTVTHPTDSELLYFCLQSTELLTTAVPVAVAPEKISPLTSLFGPAVIVMKFTPIGVAPSPAGGAAISPASLSKSNSASPSTAFLVAVCVWPPATGDVTLAVNWPFAGDRSNPSTEIFDRFALFSHFTRILAASAVRTIPRSRATTVVTAVPSLTPITPP